jgi:RNA polymerase sigma factor (sigma-70 family)
MTLSNSARRTASSELETFSALVNDYRKPLYRFILRNIGNPSDAEDIAQQTFLEACRAISSFRDESELSTSLYDIAMNLLRNYRNRAPHRVREYEPECVPETLPADVDGAEVLIERMELMTVLYGHIDCLPHDLKQIFLLVAIEGHSYDEAAELLDIPIGTVRSRLFQAREAVKARLPDLQDALLLRL